jgi:LacI family transcriptional regulator, galactose operon repressor
MSTSQRETRGSTPDKSRVTLAQVADLAGVSPTTVSHVLSGKRMVGATTRGHVQDAIRQLGYRPNNIARSLRTSRSRMVAVVVPDITNPFYSVLTRGLADGVYEAGYGTYVCNTDGLAERETTFLEDVLDRGVDGIVMASVHLSSGAVGPARLGTPIVYVGGALDHHEADLVTADDQVGSHLATQHLISRGSSRIAMIQGPPETGSARDEGYRSALAEAGMVFDPALMVRGDWTRQGGRRAMHTLMAGVDRPDAVFCANDLTAIGAVDAARDLGLSIPADVAVVGFDDVDAATIVSPTLTTVRNPAYDTGCAAGDLLLSRMLGEYTDEGRTVVLPCPLVRRESA